MACFDRVGYVGLLHLFHHCQPTTYYLGRRAAIQEQTRGFWASLDRRDISWSPSQLPALDPREILPTLSLGTAQYPHPISEPYYHQSELAIGTSFEIRSPLPRWHSQAKRWGGLLQAVKPSRPAIPGSVQGPKRPHNVGKWLQNSFFFFFFLRETPSSPLACDCFDHIWGFHQDPM